MDIQIPRITKPIDLSDYAPEFAGKGVAVYVWVNHPRDFYARYMTLCDENAATMAKVDKLKQSKKPSKTEVAKLTAETQRIGKGFTEWWAELWSQHTDPETHWTVEGVSKLIRHETDPQLYGWLCQRSMDLIAEHKLAAKKK